MSKEDGSGEGKNLYFFPFSNCGPFNYEIIISAPAAAVVAAAVHQDKMTRKMELWGKYWNFN